MATPMEDPWLAARMADRTEIARAEAILYPAIRQAVDEFIRAARYEMLGATTASAAFANTDPPDLTSFPGDSLWTRLVTDRIVPAARRVFDAAYLRLSATRDRLAGRSDDYTDTLPSRLAAFPRNVWDRVRSAVAQGLARQENPQALRARVAALMTLEEWDGQVMTMTRTETMAALNAGAFNAALDEQERTDQRWEKRWQATHDQRVRHTHKEADGQIRELFQPFRVGGHRLQFPGDPQGPPEEVFNCRCSCRYGPAGDPTLTAAPTPRRSR